MIIIIIITIQSDNVYRSPHHRRKIRLMNNDLQRAFEKIFPIRNGLYFMQTRVTIHHLECDTYAMIYGNHSATEKGCTLSNLSRTIKYNYTQYDFHQHGTSLNIL